MNAPATPRRASQPSRPARDHPFAPGRRGFALINMVFLIGVVLIGALDGWPIYASREYLIVVGAALVAGALVASLFAWKRWSGWLLLVATAGVYLGIGVPLAVPSVLSGAVSPVGAVIGVLTAPAVGWKGLLTLQLPLGSYQATLAPALIVVLAATVLGLWLAWRVPRLWPLAAPVVLTVPLFAIIFGSSTTSIPWQVMGWVVPAPTELVVGVASMLLLVLWFSWRSGSGRRRALRAAERASGIRAGAKGRAASARRIALAVGMMMVSTVVAVAVAPSALSGGIRTVPRAAVDPRQTVDAELSPLTSYRKYFAEENYDKVLFTVAGADSGRVRVATMPFYNGLVATVTDPTRVSADPVDAFLRVPSRVAGVGGQPVEVVIEIVGYSGTWVPTVGSLTAITFTSAGRQALGDGFYYNAVSQTGVETAAGGLSAGAVYEQAGTDPVVEKPISGLRPPRQGPSLDDAIVPASLVSWVRLQNAPPGGEGLEQLVGRLRARGYLSHSLMVEESLPSWAADLGQTAIETSRSGHSTDRIGDLFVELLNKQQQRPEGAPDDQLVAGIGDDEQFAVAVVLIADQLGFPARIVLGANLSNDAADEQAIPACVNGECRGKNMTAWVEVQDVSGVWTPIDVTPQHTQPVSEDLSQHRDPQNATSVTPPQVKVVPPLEAQASGTGARRSQQETRDDAMGQLLGILRVAGIVVLGVVIVVSPFATVLVIKVLRRRSRRLDDPTGSVVGGWDEYVDAAVDHGLPVPGSQTRTELARLYGANSSGGPLRLAVLADRASFSGQPTDDQARAQYWEQVDSECGRFDEGRGFWAKLRARLSLRSLVASAKTGMPGRRA